MCITTLTAKNLKDQIEFTMGRLVLVGFVRLWIFLKLLQNEKYIKEMNKSTGEKANFGSHFPDI